MKRRVLIIGALASTVLWSALALPASARWAYGNGATDLEVNSDGPAGTTQVCANRIRGSAGLSDLGDPATFVAPPGPYTTRTVEVFASDQSLDGSTAEAGGLRRTDGVLVPPTAVQTTAALTLLTPFGEYEDFQGAKYTVYAAAPFDIVPAPGSIAPGDYIAIKLRNYLAYVTTVAIACAPTPTSARIDILPGLSPNYVVPWLKVPVLPVRLFGSATLDVSTVSGVKLGSARAVTFTGWLSGLTAVRDRNGDGFADRDYYFAPADTGIGCSSTSATLTGSSGTTAFSATDSVRPVLCRTPR